MKPGKPKPKEVKPAPACRCECKACDIGYHRAKRPDCEHPPRKATWKAN